MRLNHPTATVSFFIRLNVFRMQLVELGVARGVVVSLVEAWIRSEALDKG